MGDKRIGKDAAVLTTAKMITMFIALLSNMLLSRFRTVEEYGTYSQLNIVVSLFVAFLMFGLPSSVSYFLALAKDEIERRRFLSVYYTLVTLLCLIIGLVLVSTVKLIQDYFNNPEIGSFTYFLFIYPWANVTISGISNVLVVYGKTKSLMVINIATALVALLSVIIIQCLGFGFQTYMKAFLFGNILISLFIYVIVYRIEGHISVSIDRNLLQKIFKYSIPIGLATLVGTINIEVDKLMIGHMMDTESLAYYANAGRELPLVFIASSLTAVLLPQLVRGLKNGRVWEVVHLWQDSIEISFIFMCFFATICVVFAPQIVTFLYSSKYLPGVNVFIVYSIILLWRTTYFGMVLNAVGKTKMILWSSILALILNVLLNIVFYMIWGFIGPAIASFVSIGVVDLAQLLYTCKVVQVPFSKIFPWKQLGIIIVINMIMGFLVYRITMYCEIGILYQDLIKCVLIGSVFFIVYFASTFKRLQSLWIKLNR